MLDTLLDAREIVTKTNKDSFDYYSHLILLVLSRLK